MSPAFKYSWGRLGLFLVCLLLLLPTPLNILVKAMLAMLVSAVLGYFLLAKWRNQMGEQLSQASAKRTAEKNRLRAALAGDEDAILAGDRVAAADVKTDDRADRSHDDDVVKTDDTAAVKAAEAREAK